MNYYTILGISAAADEESIRRAFRTLARKYHPDAGAGSSPEKFRQIVEAYETLRDRGRRARYDASLRAGRPMRHRVEPLRQQRYAERRFTEEALDDLFERLFSGFDDPFF
jgi:DnaJ-class molecular chaperone